MVEVQAVKHGRRIAGVILTLALTALGAFVVWRMAARFARTVEPSEPTAPPTASQATVTDGSDPANWSSVGETANWMDAIDFCVQDFTVSKTLPQGYSKDEVEYYIPTETELSQGWAIREAQTTDEAGTLTSDYVYVDATVSWVCRSLGKDVLSLQATDGFPFSVMDTQIVYYNRQTKAIKIHYECDGRIKLSATAEKYGNGGYLMQVGDIIEARLLFIVPESDWKGNEMAFLLSPQYSVCDDSYIQSRGYSRPYVWLNREE